MAVELAHSRGCIEVPQARQLLTTTMNICSLPEINSLLRKLYLVPGRLRREQDLQICPAISLVEPECAAKAGRDLLGRNGNWFNFKIKIHLIPAHVTDQIDCRVVIGAGGALPHRGKRLQASRS